MRTDVAVLLVVALGLRVAGLNSGLWFDEIVTLVESARLPVAAIFTEFPGVNAHPLYSLLAHGSIVAFGESAWALRLPAAVFGVLSVGAALALASRLMGRAEAWAGALLLAVSYHHIWFSQNARGYTLMGWCALVSTIVLLDTTDRRRWTAYVAYALVCAVGVYTHLTMAFVVAGHAVVILGGQVAGWQPALSHPWRPLVAAWIGAAVLAGALYAPVLPGLLAHFGDARPVEAASIATGHWAVAEILRSVVFGAGVPAAILGGLVAAVGAVALWRRAPLAVALLVMPALVTAGAVAVLGQPMRPRFFFFVSGAAAVFAGRGCSAIAAGLRRIRGVETLQPMWVVLPAVFVAVLSAPALLRNYRVPKQDFAGAVAALDREAAAGTRIAAAGPACFPIAAYFSRPWPCLETTADLEAFQAAPGRGVIVVTLGDYVVNAGLRRELPRVCREVRRFPGTLGGGDVIVCDPTSGGQS